MTTSLEYVSYKTLIIMKKYYKLLNWYWVLIYVFSLWANCSNSWILTVCLTQVETEVNDLKEQLNERKTQVEELQLQLGKREEELAQSLMRIDQEAAG